MIFKPTSSTNRGITPLALVVSLCLDQDYLGFHKIAKRLLATGKVNPVAKNLYGGTLLDISRSGGPNELVKLMESFLDGGD